MERGSNTEIKVSESAEVRETPKEKLIATSPRKVQVEKAPYNKEHNFDESLSAPGRGKANVSPEGGADILSEKKGEVLCENFPLVKGSGRSRPCQVLGQSKVRKRHLYRI